MIYDMGYMIYGTSSPRQPQCNDVQYSTYQKPTAESKACIEGHQHSSHSFW